MQHLKQPATGRRSLPVQMLLLAGVLFVLANLLMATMLPRGGAPHATESVAADPHERGGLRFRESDVPLRVTHGSRLDTAHAPALQTEGHLSARALRERAVAPSPTSPIAASAAGARADAISIHTLVGAAAVPLRAFTDVPRYEHNASLMALPSGLRLPTPADCAVSLQPTFFAVSMHSAKYAGKAARLLESCDKVGVCCVSALVPSHAFDAVEGSREYRLRFISSKPLFMLRVLESSSLPVAWLDTDLEFITYPSLFDPLAWSPPRDALLWNWQANVSWARGRRLKMASGVAFFNRTDAALSLLRAWAEAMAFPPNRFAPDDQTLDELVNNDGWIDRATFGWLPAAYLRMAHRHPNVSPVIEHDRGRAPGSNGGGGSSKPQLPPKRKETIGAD